MTTLSGLFIAEGSSDRPLAELVEVLFLERGVNIRLTTPEFERLGSRIERNLTSRLRAAMSLVGQSSDVIVVHRDADNAGRSKRLDEIAAGVGSEAPDAVCIPIIPVRTTEAWLLLDESAIRRVAGNPKGRNPLPLPKPNAAERLADPKQMLRECLLAASQTTGRRRETVAKRFNQHRRQLLATLDRDGPINSIASWQAMLDDVDTAVRLLSPPG